MKFKVGDRVKDDEGDVGTFLAQHKNEAWVDFDDIGTMSVDLIVLKKLKPKREPRRVWVHPDRMTDNVSVSMVPTFGWTEFIEAKK